MTLVHSTIMVHLYIVLQCKGVRFNVRRWLKVYVFLQNVTGSTLSSILSSKNSPDSAHGQCYAKAGIHCQCKCRILRVISMVLSIIRRRSLKRSFIFTVRPTVHTDPSRKRSFSKTLFKPEEFENAGWAFSWGRKTVWKRSFSKTMTSR